MNEVLTPILARVTRGTELLPEEIEAALAEILEGRVADVLEALGVAIDLGPAGVSRCVAEAGIGFCLAPRYHPAMRFLGPARKELGVPTTFNFLGPLANPAHVTRQAVGVSDDTMATRMVGALRVLGAERAMVFHGDDGLDELTTATTSTVHELVDGEVHSFTLDPLDLGI